ncbi:hypothetical protein SAMN05421548_13916 [Paraburkholderia lycopersici]|uniref:Uncharacterized protein n=1 Tax=Paraburkholderia lycopersici TaxID=416944 RepID=A0A1G7BEZ0_9BURK|nr:hypothetical protein SAMN05421548_13916 [Paraburkholderia lycopersici]
MMGTRIVLMPVPFNSNRNRQLVAKQINSVLDADSYGLGGQYASVDRCLALVNDIYR